MREILSLIMLTIAIWNIITFIIYGIDKNNAIKHKQRISEKNLLLCAFMFGGIGAFIAMRVFSHKTKHWNFKICVPIAALLSVVTIILLANLY